jgi:hypothetical protein
MPAVWFQFLILFIACFPHGQRDLHERPDNIKFQTAQPGFDLYTFDTVIVVNVFHLMGENGCQLVLTGH